MKKTIWHYTPFLFLLAIVAMMMLCVALQAQTKFYVYQNAANKIDSTPVSNLQKMTFEGSSFSIYNTDGTQKTYTKSNVALMSFDSKMIKKSTSIKSGNRDLKISISPNPVINYLNINSDTRMEQIEILDMQGKSVLKRKVNTKTSHIDLSFLPKGIYMLQISSKSGQGTEKIIKN